MKKILFTLCCALAAFAACQEMEQGNTSMDYETLDVNFSIAADDFSWAEGTEFGVVATCTRDGNEGHQMSGSKVAKFVYHESGAITPKSENDKIVAQKGDHNFQFYVIYPCPTSDIDITAIPVEVPAVQTYSKDVASTLPFFGKITPITVVPTVEVKMNPVFGIINFQVPNDIREGLETTVKTMTISPAEAGFTGKLVQKGIYDMKTGTFTASASSNEITIDFGEGLELVDPYTKVSVIASPFVVPEGGLAIRFANVDETTTDITALNAKNEVGKELVSGGSMETWLSGISDGIIPVKFPVVFPLGIPEGGAATDGINHPNNTDNVWITSGWKSDEAYSKAGNWTGEHGIWYCKEQSQAYMKWVWDEKIAETGVTHFLETVNATSSSRLISTPGVKGVWTDDYFEFVIPVRKFAAGTTLRLSMPFYTNKGPVFWEVLYQDGDQWKSTAVENVPALAGSEVTRTATWAVYWQDQTDTCLKTVNMKFEKAIPSGEIHIKIKCVDGTVLASASGQIMTVTKPQNSSNKANGTFYFYDHANKANQKISIEQL